MNAAKHPTPASELGWADKADVLLGRAHWAWADYIAEGYRQFDALFAASGKTFGPAWVGERKANARAFAEINCPPSKRGRAISDAAMVPVMEEVS
jgi:hypothetical protein